MRFSTFGAPHSTFGKKMLGLALRTLLASLLLSLNPESQMLNAASASPSIATDSRIKTFVFNANEVFAVTTHYGYQSNIEFGLKETIETVSVGDRVAWQIIPAGRRLFIRAMEENARTNMTIVTNLRAYQFDLRSSSASATFGSEELTYVVRFFYPDDAASGAPMPAMAFMPEPVRAPAPVAMPAPSVAAPIVTGSNTAPAATPARPINYRYTFSGANDIAPVKIYDDGRTTFFKFRGAGTPQVSVVTARGETLSVPSRRTSEGLLAVDVVAPRFSLTQAGKQVLVYNEAGGVL